VSLETRGGPRWSILASLLLLLFAVGIVPLLWTSYALVSDTRDRLELEQKTLQQATARSLSEQIALYVRSLNSEVRTITQTLEGEASASGLVSRIAEMKNTQALKRFVDPDGPIPIYYLSVVDTSCVGAQAGVLLPEPAILQLLQEGCVRGRENRPMISRPIMAASVREPILVVAVPIVLHGAAAAGTTLAVASLRPLWAMTQQMRASGTSGVDVYVVDDRGWLVAHSDPKRVEGDRDLSHVGIVRQFLDSGGRASSTGPFTMPGPDGRPVSMLGTYKSVPDDSGWGVIVQVSEEQAYYGAYEARRQSLKVVALVTLIAILLGLVFARQITQPVRLLARGAFQLASGDYGTRVQVHSSNEMGVLAAAFNHMGEQIQKAIEEIRRVAAINKELFVGSIRLLANAIDEKDPYTRGHSDRVAYYAKVIARHLGMSDDEVERVYLSGILHDVGKIGIEDKILRKAEALTDEEYEIMKQHPKKGEYILAAVPMLKAMTGDGLKHHESVDGSGYPEHLKADEIPLLGRIVCVADAFDAMTTDRPYSKAWTFERALTRLRELASRKFDAACVEAMEKAYAAGDLEKEKIQAAARPSNVVVAEASA
jgi:HD-GYP domain-containing protein (c-di-GMP phosphodiesterase class II)